MRLVPVAKIRKPHGLKGAVVVVLFSFRLKSFQEFHNGKLFVNVNDENIPVEIDSIFGVVKNIGRFYFKGYDSIESVEKFRGCELILQQQNDNFLLNDLIGLKIKFNDEILTLVDIHDFGAGVVLDTDAGDMISLEELDLNSISNGYISFL